MQIKYRRELYKLLPENFVSLEAGVAEAYFSADILAMGASKHYMVDAWRTLDQKGDGSSPQHWHDNNYIAAVARVAKYGEKAVIMKMLTTEAAREIEDESLDLVYIDSDHSYNGVKEDIAAFWPKLKPGGVMAFHDYQNEAYGVKAAVLEFADNNKLEVNRIPEDNPADAGAWIRKP